MKTVTIELPDALIQAAKLDTADLPQEVARLLALELFQEEKVSLSRAAELCRTPLAAFMDFAATRNVSPIRYDMTHLEEDRHDEGQGHPR
jgi:predicted HTH domain antitoxin